MSSTTTNLGLTKTTAAETIGQTWAASNESGGNFDIIDTKMGAVGNTSLQAQVTALNSKIARTNVGVTLNTTGNQYFTHGATHGNRQNGFYGVGINVTTKIEVPSNTELNIGNVSVNPAWTATGYVVVNNSSLLVGGVQISASGGIYIRLNDSIPAGRDLIIFAMTTNY